MGKRTRDRNFYTICKSSKYIKVPVPLILGKIRGQKINLPNNYKPSQDFLTYHRDHVFVES